jgi:hypothetical protein
MLRDELRYRSTTLRIAQGRNHSSWLVEQQNTLRSGANGFAIHLDLIHRRVDLATQFSDNLSVDTHTSLFDELLHLSTGTNTTFS